MKKKNWLALVLIAACLAVFFVYRTAARLASDTEAPKISTGNMLLELSTQEPRAALLQGITARDNRDGDVTASLVVESICLEDSDGTITVTYAAFDRAGNVAKAQRQARYTDYESPRFSLSGPLVFSQNSGFEVLSSISARDALEGDISHRIRATSLSESAITSQGVHDISFRVTNSLGETVELILPLEVYQPGSYQANLELTDYLVYLPVGSSFSVKDYLKSYTRGTETVTLSSGLPAGYTLRTIGQVDTNTPGVYDVSYWVICTNENSSNTALNQTVTGYSKLIIVVEG